MVLTLQGKDYMLSTFVSGNAVQLLQDKSDEEVVDMCLQCLKKLFNKKVRISLLNFKPTWPLLIGR